MLASLKVMTPENIEMVTDSMGYDADWELKPKAAKKAKPGRKQPPPRPQSTPALADELVVDALVPCPKWPGAAQGSAGPALAMPALQQADLGGQAQGAAALQQCLCGGLGHDLGLCLSSECTAQRAVAAQPGLLVVALDPGACGDIGIATRHCDASRHS